MRCSDTFFRRLSLCVWTLAAGLLALSREVKAAELNAMPTVFVVGDSTARNNANGAQGWGDALATFFDGAKINVFNRAMAGRSSRTFISEGRWVNVLKEMKAGDWVLIQMGHNDSGPVDSGRARASLPGLGEETREVTRADGSKETVHTYGWYIRKFIADTKAKGATPLLLSLTVRNIWKDGQVERGSGRYREQIAELAQSQKVTFVDVTSIVADQYNAMGTEKVKAMFGPDYVHTSPLGAELNAASVVAGLKQLNHSLSAMLSEKGRAVSTSSPTSASTSNAAAPDVAAPDAAAVRNVAPARRALPVPGDPALPSLFLIGDSTVRNGAGDGSNGQWGWGEPIAAYFDAEKINVVNRAVGGLSSRTYFTGGFWDETKAMMKPGDVLMIQFGHNDGGAINDATRARASLRGSGEESEAIDNLLTKKPEIVRTYGWYLRQFIADARAKGVASIVCSPIPRRGFTNGKANRSGGNYTTWAAEVARAQGAAFVPLGEITARQYDELGEAAVGPLFVPDNTHTTLAGAELNAKSVVAGLKALKTNPLSTYFSLKAATVVATDVPLVDAVAATNSAANFKFDFGSAQVAPGYRAVRTDMQYNRERGFGFEPGAMLNQAPPRADNAPIDSFVTSDKPFFFSVALPEGNYTVSLTMGSHNAATSTTVKAELRRLMLERVQTSPGQFVTSTFTVHIRTPQIANGGSVRLKEREKTSEMWNWDEKLTLEFNSTRPTLCTLEITRADTAPTVFLLGDSTVTDQPQEPYNSWGQMLPRFFKAGVAVANYAQSGESLRSSRSAGRLDKALSTMKAGDYAFIQFGHNDMKEKGPDIGAFTSYKTDLKFFADAIRQKGGIPVLVTSMNRRTFDRDGKITNSLGDYPAAVRQLADEEKLALIDLNAMSKSLYEALGTQKSKLAFAPNDGTHHNNYGSYQLARCIVQGIKANQLQLASLLAEDVPTFDPAHPDSLEAFMVPPSPIAAHSKPDGS